MTTTPPPRDQGSEIRTYTGIVLRKKRQKLLEIPLDEWRRIRERLAKVQPTKKAKVGMGLTGVGIWLLGVPPGTVPNKQYAWAAITGFLGLLLLHIGSRLKPNTDESLNVVVERMEVLESEFVVDESTTGTDIPTSLTENAPTSTTQLSGSGDLGQLGPSGPQEKQK